MQDRRFVALDGLRGAAALLIVLYHVRWTNHLSGSLFVQNSYLAVDLFFILSGFVISWAYRERIGSAADLSEFLTVRLFRVYPLHLAMLLALVAFETVKLIAVHRGGTVPDQMPFTGSNSVSGLIASLFMAQSWGVLDHLGWNWPSWSIGAECVAYVAFALAAWGGLLRRRWFVPACALLGLVFYGAMAVTWDTLDWTFDLGWARCLAGFALGVWASQVCAGWHIRSKAAEVLAAAALIGVIAFASGAAVVISILLFVALVAFLQSDAGPVARFLSRHALQRLGRISYSVYMVHVPVEVLFLTALKRVSGTQQGNEILLNPWIGDAVALLFVGVVLGLAVLTFRWIEDPLHRYGKALAAGRLAAPERHETGIVGAALAAASRGGPRP